jgi:biofilm protein TabA
MILDLISRCGIYEPLGERFAEGLRWLRDFDPATPDGRVEIAGDAVLALVQSYETAPGAEKQFESHRFHADIQYVVSGRERILHADAERLPVTVPFDAATDIAFHAEPAASSSLLLGAGDFAILWPGDAHKPGCMAGGRDAVRKIVVKVRLED